MKAKSWLGLGSIALALTAATTGAAQVTEKNGRYLFRLHLTKGQQLHYRAPVTIEGLLSNKPIHLKLNLDVKVLSIAGGLAKVKGHVDAGKYENTPIMQARTVVFKVDNRGQVTDATGALGGFTVVFPEFAVKLGNSFVAPVPVLLNTSAPGTEIASRDATFNFTGFVGSGDRKAAKLIFVVAGNLAPSGAMLISVKDGTMLKYATKFYLNTNAKKPLVITASFERK
jgi:hypothetical protein